MNMAKLNPNDATGRDQQLQRLMIIASGGIAIVLGSIATTNAAEFCVHCDNPPSVYTCTIASADGGQHPAGAQFLCIREIAQRHGHGTCRVSGRDNEVCSGDVVVITAPAGHPELDPADNAEPLPPANSNGTGSTNLTFDENQIEAVPDPDIPPESMEADTVNEKKTPKKKSISESKTVVELAERTAESSKEGLSNAGKAIGSAAKNTWKCVSSLFFDCF